MSLYIPQNMYPKGLQQAIDATVSNTFSCTIKGQSCNGYNIKIYNTNNTLIYTSGNISLGSPVYGDQTLSFTVPSSSGMVNGNSYTWYIYLTPDNFVTTVQSYAAQFPTNSKSILTMNSFSNPITSANFTFSATYSQAEGVALQSYEWILKDCNGNIIDDTGLVYNSSLLQYTFKGFIAGNLYTLTLNGISQNGMTCTTGSININISYSQSTTIIQPSATVECSQDCIDVKWSNAVQILGTSSGSIQYINFNELYGEINSSSIFQTGTSDTNLVPINFVDGSKIQFMFNGSASGNIINPQFKSIGKNLLNPAAGSVTSSGITCTVSTDGAITLNGTATTNIRIGLSGTLTAYGDTTALDQNIFPLNSVPYTLSSTITLPTGLTAYTRAMTPGDGNPWTINSGSTSSTATPPVNSHISYFFVRIASGASFSNFSFRLQFEQNNAITAWEQYKSSVFAITGTIGSSDFFAWNGTIGKINGLSVTTSGNFIAYKNGWIFIENLDGTIASVVPSVNYLYQVLNNANKNAILIADNYSSVVWSTNVIIPQLFTIPMICKFPVLPTGVFLQLTNQLTQQVYTLSYNSGVFTYAINGNSFTESFVMTANTSYLIALKPTAMYVRQVS